MYVRGVCHEERKGVGRDGFEVSQYYLTKMKYISFLLSALYTKGDVFELIQDKTLKVTNWSFC